MRRKLGTFAAIVVSTLLLDQWSKQLVRARFEVGESHTVIPGILDLTYVKNLGAAFGMFQGGTAFFVASALAICAVILGFILLSKHVTRFETVSLSFIAAGALGNLIDRATAGPVTDFLYLRFIDFPVFNIADCAITVGTVLFVVWVLFFSGRESTEEVRSDG